MFRFDLGYIYRDERPIVQQTYHLSNMNQMTKIHNEERKRMDSAVKTGR